MKLLEGKNEIEKLKQEEFENKKLKEKQREHQNKEKLKIIELEKQKELDKKKDLEKQKELEKQNEIEKQKTKIPQTKTQIKGNIIENNPHLKSTTKETNTTKANSVYVSSLNSNSKLKQDNKIIMTNLPVKKETEQKKDASKTNTNSAQKKVNIQNKPNGKMNVIISIIFKTIDTSAKDIIKTKDSNKEVIKKANIKNNSKVEITTHSIDYF
jgi:hypothetical protein